MKVNNKYFFFYIDMVSSQLNLHHPIFFYVPVIDRNKSCIGLDKKLLIAAFVMRSFTDVIYVFHIIFQFRIWFLSPLRVFVKGHLVNDPVAIARRYLSSYFFIIEYEELVVVSLYYSILSKGVSNLSTV
ncbi:hypothetical protein MKW92_008751 [Papaver armeniacum]|nr:hypothetical protein MKW92_008751 [Papaver armeniacum]